MQYLAQNEKDIENNINPHAVRLTAMYVFGLILWFISLIVLMLFTTPSVNQAEQIGGPFVVYTGMTVIVYVIIIYQKIRGLWLAIIALLSIISLICIYCGVVSIIALF